MGEKWELSTVEGASMKTAEMQASLKGEKYKEKRTEKIQDEVNDHVRDLLGWRHDEVFRGVSRARCIV